MKLKRQKAATRVYVTVIGAVIIMVVISLALYLSQSQKQSSSNSTSSLSGFNVEKIQIDNAKNSSKLLTGYVYVATTPSEQAWGFQFATSFGNCNGFATTTNACIGMIFVFQGYTDQCFWMLNTILPLQQVWISANGTVTSIYQAHPENTNSVCQMGQYVLETNPSAPISVGDSVHQSALSSTA